jgi:transcriptional regulator with XRE-family HTH domain
MPDLRSSSPAKRALAAELRRVREISGMSGDEVAGLLHWSPSKISRIETNRTGVKGPDLDRLLELYNVDNVQSRQLTALAKEPEPRGWWNAYADSIDPEYAAYISLEASASQIRWWSPEMINGLLQIEDYASELMEIIYGSPPSISPRTIQDRIDVRLRRQDLLTSPQAKHFTFILDEATLLRRHGSAQVMRDQLAQLVRVSRLPNVTIRVLAFSGVHPVVNPGGFAILEFTALHQTPISDVVYVERLLSSGFVDDDNEAHQYRLAFERLSESALSPGESSELIARTAAERWS